jgi:YfiH family protein
MREVSFRGSGFELPLLQSNVIPGAFHHGFTTRRGGVSEGVFASLNLGGRWGDDPAHLAENQRRFRAAAGTDAVHFATQVHGRAVAAVGAGDTPAATARREADALVAAAPGTTVAVYVADCVPVVVADIRTGACAAIHAGWRGTVAGVLSEALAHLVRACGARVEDLRVAIGPSIGPCCFEVGPEVVAAVEEADPGARAEGAILVRSPRDHVDLWTLNQRQALSFGVPASALDVARLCTCCDSARFFSYRRDRGKTGQMAAFISRAAAGGP